MIQRLPCLMSPSLCRCAGSSECSNAPPPAVSCSDSQNTLNVLTHAQSRFGRQLLPSSDCRLEIITCWIYSGWPSFTDTVGNAQGSVTHALCFSPHVGVSHQSDKDRDPCLTFRPHSRLLPTDGPRLVQHLEHLFLIWKHLNAAFIILRI
jgi:hypothetical protein